MSDKPSHEWLCPEHLLPQHEDVQQRQIELQKLQDQIKIKAHEFQLKNSELWNELRESISSLGPEHQRAVYNACHLRYDANEKKIYAYSKGHCPICRSEADDAMKQLAAGQGGIVVTGGKGKGPSIQPPPAADVSDDIMREKRRGRRGMFPDQDAETGSN